MIKVKMKDSSTGMKKSSLSFRFVSPTQSYHCNKTRLDPSSCLELIQKISVIFKTRTFFLTDQKKRNVYIGGDKLILWRAETQVHVSWRDSRCLRCVSSLWGEMLHIKSDNAKRSDFFFKHLYIMIWDTIILKDITFLNDIFMFII